MQWSNILEMRSNYLSDVKKFQGEKWIVTIPLVDPKPYQYFQLYSLPVKVNNSYQIILPKSKYVAINEQNYVLIEETVNVLIIMSIYAITYIQRKYIVTYLVKLA